MSFLIHLDATPIPAHYPVHPGLTGYLAILHDEDEEKTVYVGFLAPANILPQGPGPFVGTVRLLAWLARGVAIHDKQVNHDTIQWLDRALQQPTDLRPTIIMHSLPEVDELVWKVDTPLFELRDMAEAELVALDLQALVDPLTTDEPESVTRF